MTNPVPRSTPFQGLFDFRRDFDQIFNRMMSGWPAMEGPATESSIGFAPTVESYVDKTNKVYRSRVALPGVDPKDVKIHVQGNILTISGERKASRSAQDVDFLHNEIWYGTFERTLSLPEGVDADKLTAECHNGVLEISAPVAAAALPRRIEIKSAPTAKQMAA